MPSTFRMTGTTRPCEKSHITDSLLFTLRELIHCILLFITSNLKKTETKTIKRTTSDYIIIHLRYLRSGYGHTYVNIVPVHDLFSCVVNN